MSNLEPRSLTWVALLGRWVEFAQSAVALPDDATGRAWRAAVPEIIGLQAVTMALSETGLLDRDEQALALDRARLLIDRHVERLHACFTDPRLHPMLQELIHDALKAMRVAEAQEPGA